MYTSNETALNATERRDGELQFGLNDLLTLLRKMHTEGWAYMEHVGLHRKTPQRTNAIASSLRKRDGYAVHYFDVRTSRNEWLEEINASHWQEQYSDCCWIVAAPGAVKPEELPAGWGLIVPKLLRGPRKAMTETDMVSDYRLTVVVQAKKRAGTPISREFFAQLMRSAADEIEDKAASLAHANEFRLRAEFQRQLKATEERAQRRYAELEQRVRVFKEQTGISLLNSYDGPAISTIRIAQALESFGPIGATEILSGLDKLARSLNDNARLVSQTAQEIRANFAAAPAAPVTPQWGQKQIARKSLAA